MRGGKSLRIRLTPIRRGPLGKEGEAGRTL